MTSRLITRPLVLALSMAVSAPLLAQSGTSTDPAASRSERETQQVEDARRSAEDRTTANQRGDRRDDAKKHKKSEMTLDDNEALHVLMEINNHEIEAGRLAQSRASNAEVKAYAEKMVQEHEANNGAARNLLTSGGQQPDAQLAQKLEKMREKHRKQREKLTSLSGAEFDQAYMDAMAEGHGKALEKVGDELLPQSQRAENRRHMDETLRAIAEHREHAHRIKAQLR